MTLKPLGDRVIIRPVQAPTQTDSGLHLVEHWKPEQIGTLVRAGEACPEEIQTAADRGLMTLFSWSSGQEFLLHETDERLLTMSYKDLLAVIEP